MAFLDRLIALIYHLIRLVFTIGLFFVFVGRRRFISAFHNVRTRKRQGYFGTTILHWFYFFSDERCKGYGCNFWDQDVAAPTGIRIFWLRAPLSLLDKVRFSVLLGYRNLGYIDVFLEGLNVHIEKNTSLSSLAKLYLADFSLFVRSWSKEFDFDKKISDNPRLEDVFKWCKAIPRQSGSISLEYIESLIDGMEAQQKHWLFVFHFRLLLALEKKQFLLAYNYLGKIQKEKPLLMNYTKSALEAILEVKPQSHLAGRDYLLAKRIAVEKIPGAHVVAEYIEQVYSFSYTVIGLDNRKYNREKSFTSSNWKAATLREGTFVGYAANDILVNGVSPISKVAYDNVSDPRKSIFSRTRAFSDQQGNEVYGIKRVSKTIEEVILLPGIAENYFHFMLDSIGAYLLLPPDIVRGKKVMVGGIIGGFKKFHNEVFDMLGVEAPLLMRQSDGELGFRNAVWCQHTSPLNMPNLNALIKIEKLMCKNLKVDSVPTRKVFFLRLGLRRIEAAVMLQIKQLVGEQGFEIVDPSTLTIKAQIELMRETKILVVEGGAAAFNALYMREGGVVVIVTTQATQRDSFVPICYVRGLKLIYVMSEVGDIYFNPLHLWTSMAPKPAVASLNVAIIEAQKLAQII